MVVGMIAQLITLWRPDSCCVPNTVDTSSRSPSRQPLDYQSARGTISMAIITINVSFDSRIIE
jgi:hypothetical protein